MIIWKQATTGSYNWHISFMLFGLRFSIHSSNMCICLPWNYIIVVESIPCVSYHNWSNLERYVKNQPLPIETHRKKVFVLGPILDWMYFSFIFSCIWHRPLIKTRVVILRSKFWSRKIKSQNDRIAVKLSQVTERSDIYKPCSWGIGIFWDIRVRIVIA